MADLSITGLRLHLLSLWDDLEHSYGATVHRDGWERWDVRRLQVEVAVAQRRLDVIAEGVAAGWLPPDAVVAVDAEEVAA